MKYYVFSFDRSTELFDPAWVKTRGMCVPSEIERMEEILLPHQSGPLSVKLERKHPYHVINKKIDKDPRKLIIYFDNTIISSNAIARAYRLCIPAVDINGSRDIILPTGEEFKRIDPDLINKYYLSNPDDRIKARNIYSISLVHVYATGGYPISSPIKRADHDLYLIQCAAPSFENQELEYRLLISKGKTNIGVSGLYLDKEAYTNLMYHTFRNLLQVVKQSSFEDEKEDQVRTLRIPALGTGFFANLAGKNISEYLIPLIVKGLELALWERFDQSVKCLDQVELLDFSPHQTFKPTMDSINGIALVHSKNKDLLTAPNPNEICYVVNAGDANSWVGNEVEYNSVDAMVGNNTDVVYTQTPRNPRYEELSSYRPLWPCYEYND